MSLCLAKAKAGHMIHWFQTIWQESCEKILYARFMRACSRVHNLGLWMKTIELKVGNIERQAGRFRRDFFFPLLGSPFQNHGKLIREAKFESETYSSASTTTSDKISHTVRKVLFSCLALLQSGVGTKPMPQPPCTQGVTLTQFQKPKGCP